MLGKSSFMALCSMVVLITWFLGIVASQTTMDTAEVREQTDVTDQATAAATFSVPEPAASFFGEWESAGFSGASGFVHLGSENSPWTPPVFPPCQNLFSNKFISYNGFVGCSLPRVPKAVL